MKNLNKKSWIEYKFEKETPSCRTLHAEVTHNEKLMIYGGTDMKNGDARVDELWLIEPLKLQKPKWHRFGIRDE